MELQGLTGWSTYYFQMKGNLVKYSVGRGGETIGKFNITGATVAEIPNTKTVLLFKIVELLRCLN